MEDTTRAYTGPDYHARDDIRSVPHGVAVLVRYAGPTNTRPGRWIATADHPISRAVVEYDHGIDHGAPNAAGAVRALIAKWSKDYATRYPGHTATYRVLSYGHLPAGDYAFIVALKS